MNKIELLYEGKAKKVFSTEDDNFVIVSYKDDATAFNGVKKGAIENKGIVNNTLSNFFMQLLEKHSIPTHFVNQISDRETIVKKVDIIKLEVIIRNIAAGSFSKRYGVKEGTILKIPSIEFSLKDDALGDPLINYYHILSLGLSTPNDLDYITRISFKINEILKVFLIENNIELVDFKLEFGKTKSGQIVLADEISPDTCRFWDKFTHKKLDKDRFRQDLGDVKDAYFEMFHRVLDDNKKEKG